MCVLSLDRMLLAARTYSLIPCCLLFIEDTFHSTVGKVDIELNTFPLCKDEIYYLPVTPRGIRESCAAPSTMDDGTFRMLLAFMHQTYRDPRSNMIRVVLLFTIVSYTIGFRSVKPAFFPRKTMVVNSKDDKQWELPNLFQEAKDMLSNWDDVIDDFMFKRMGNGELFYGKRKYKPSNKPNMNGKYSGMGISDSMKIEMARQRKEEMMERRREQLRERS